MASDTILGPNGIILAVIDEDVKVDIRRYCGYPAYGQGMTGFYQLGYYIQSFGQLELRMNTLTVSEYARIDTLFLPNLTTLEDDLLIMREAMIVKQAAVFHRNENEAADRHGEFTWWRMHLVNYLGVKPGPHLDAGGSGGFCQVKMVV